MSSGRARAGRRALAAALGTAVVACGTGAGDAPPATVAVDLNARFRFSASAPRTEAVDLGDPAQRHHLVRGWSEPAEPGPGLRGVFPVGPDSVLQFHAGARPAPTTIRVSRTNLGAPSAAPSTADRGAKWRREPVLLLEVNGLPVRRALRAAPGAAAGFEVPAELLRPGWNVLRLRHQIGPSRVWRRQHGRPRLLYHRVEFEVAGEAALVPTPAGRALVLPPGSTGEVFFRAPRDAWLRLTVAPSASRMAPIRVTVTGDGEPAEVVLDDPAPTGVIERPLPVPAGTVTRLEIAVGASGAPVRLAENVILGTPDGSEPGPSAPPSDRRPNVVLYVVDTLRADRLGSYGRSPSLTPTLDRLAAEGIVFEHAVAQASWTRPSAASMLTGQYPLRHGAVTLRDGLDPGIPTLAERFARSGYATAGFVTNLNVAPPFGFGRGFDLYRYLPEEPGSRDVYVDAAALHAEALAWLRAPREQPFFLYLHATDPHAPYRPRGEGAARLGLTTGEIDGLLDRLRANPDALSAADVQRLAHLYDAECVEFDAALAGFLDGLRTLGLEQNTLLALVADHGEEFREHGGLHHGRTLYAELVDVPMILRLPGRRSAGRRVPTITTHVDLFPTLLSLAGLPAPPGPGRALLTRQGEPLAGDDEVFLQTALGGPEVSAVVVPPWKVILPTPNVDAAPEVYDMRSDRREQTDLGADHAVLVGYARQRLAEVQVTAAESRDAQAPAHQVDDATLQRLRALGYVVE